MAIEPSEHEDAFEVFCRMRQSTHLKLDKLKQKAVSYKANLSNLSQQLRGVKPSRQTVAGMVRTRKQTINKLTECLIQIQECERNLNDVDSIDNEEHRREFNRLCANPALIELFVYDSGLAFIFAARYEYNGQLYDMSDWLFVLDSKGRGSARSVHEERSGLIPGAPALQSYAGHYRIGYNFCFGENAQVIDGYLQAREYASALDIMAYALCSMNEGHERYVPLIFRKIEEGSEHANTNRALAS